MSGLAGQEVTGKILDERVAISVQRGRTGLTVELTFMEFENLMRDLRRLADVDPFGIPGELFGDPPPRRGEEDAPCCDHCHAYAEDCDDAEYERQMSEKTVRALSGLIAARKHGDARALDGELADAERLLVELNPFAVTL